MRFKDNGALRFNSFKCQILMPLLFFANTIYIVSKYYILIVIDSTIEMGFCALYSQWWRNRRSNYLKLTYTKNIYLSSLPFLFWRWRLPSLHPSANDLSMTAYFVLSELVLIKNVLEFEAIYGDTQIRLCVGDGRRKDV